MPTPKDISSLPSTVSAQLTFNGVAGTTMTYSTAGFSPGDTLVLARQPVTTLTWGGTGSPSVTAVSPEVVQGLNALVVSPPVASETDADNRTTAWVLDAQGRPLQTVAPDGGLTTDAYSNGFLSAETDPLLRTTTYALDGKGYVTQETLPDGSAISMQYQSAFHALTTYTDERNNTTTYSYDALGHKLTETNALGQTTSYAYSSAGLLTQVTDPLGPPDHLRLRRGPPADRPERRAG